VRSFLGKHGQTLINFGLFAALAGGLGYRVYETWIKNRFDFVEAMFFAGSMVQVVIILFRWRHVAISREPLHQLVAILAFLSAAMFDIRPLAPYPWMLTAAVGLTILGIFLGVITTLGLGRSFGILIAQRRIKTSGVYRIVRHPMYMSDTVMRTSFIAANPSIFNLILYIGATGCYVVRALLEERFLVRDPAYVEYMRTVNYRFIPWVF
jgi:protein-S-isoprenylcysteine O-methyltransferase Ste14